MHFRNFTICHKLLFLQFENNLGNEEGENEKDRVCRKSLPIFHREAGKLKDTGRGDCRQKPITPLVQNIHYTQDYIRRQA